MTQWLKHHEAAVTIRKIFLKCESQTMTGPYEGMQTSEIKDMVHIEQYDLHFSFARSDMVGNKPSCVS